MPETDSLSSNILPIIIALVATFLTVAFLFTLTNRADVLAVTFGFIYVAILSLKHYLQTNVYLPRKDGKTEARGVLILRCCDIVSAVVIIVISALILELFTLLRLRITPFAWWTYIVVFSLIITFLLPLIILAGE
jgi:hypothetical protein